MNSPARFRLITLVAAGGIAGTGARIAVADAFHPGGFPAATFIVNIVGALLLGAIVTLATKAGPGLEPTLRALLGTGLCGGLTTFSTACLECFNLIRTGHALLGIEYVVLTICGGLIACYVGLQAIELLYGTLAKTEAD